MHVFDQRHGSQASAIHLASAKSPAKGMLEAAIILMFKTQARVCQPAGSVFNTCSKGLSASECDIFDKPGNISMPYG
jgi:hypothetical protein